MTSVHGTVRPRVVRDRDPSYYFTWTGFWGTIENSSSCILEAVVAHNSRRRMTGRRRGICRIGTLFGARLCCFSHSVRWCTARFALADAFGIFCGKCRFSRKKQKILTLTSPSRKTDSPIASRTKNWLDMPKFSFGAGGEPSRQAVIRHPPFAFSDPSELQ